MTTDRHKLTANKLIADQLTTKAPTNPNSNVCGQLTWFVHIWYTFVLVCLNITFTSVHFSAFARFSCFQKRHIILEETKNYVRNIFKHCDLSVSIGSFFFGDVMIDVSYQNNCCNPMISDPPKIAKLLICEVTDSREHFRGTIKVMNSILKIIYICPIFIILLFCAHVCIFWF